MPISRQPIYTSFYFLLEWHLVLAQWPRFYREMGRPALNHIGHGAPSHAQGTQATRGNEYILVASAQPKGAVRSGSRAKSSHQVRYLASLEEPSAREMPRVSSSTR